MWYRRWVHLDRPIAAMAVCMALLFGCVQYAAHAAPAAKRAEWPIRLDLDRGGWTQAGDVHPLGVGVPLREGQLRDPSNLALQTDDDQPIPAVFDVRRRYDDGSIQWLWIDFQALAARHYVLRSRGANPLPSPGVRVTDDGDALSVDNGVLRLLWSKAGATPTSISLNAAPAEPLVEKAGGDGFYLITPDGQRAVMAGPAADLQWTVERANRLKTVLLVEGWYARLQDGERMARGRIRFHVYWNQPWLKMEHTFIVTRSNDEVTYKEIGITWPFDAGRDSRARFGRAAGIAPLEMSLREAEDAWIHQEAYPVYHKRKIICRAGLDDKQRGDFREASGWCELNTARAGVLIGVKDFAPQFPKELTASRGGVSAKLWSGRSGQALDYRPRTLIDEWWGDWFHRNMEPYCRTFLMADKKAAWEDYNPSCVGVARTHELLIAFHDTKTAHARSEALFRAFQTEPLVLPAPRWTCHVGAKTFWPMAAKGEGGPAYDDIERLISAWFDQYALPQQMFPFTGWYDWGRTPVDRYAVDRTEDGERVWAHWFRMHIVNRYLFNKYLMIAWARSGDRKYYEMATRLNRFIRDYYVVQWGGKKGYLNQRGHTPMLPTWGGASLRPGVDSENMTGLALEYLFRGTEGCRDAIMLHQGALLPAFRATPDFTSTQPDMLASSMIGMWRLTGDETLKARIRELHRAWTSVKDPAGVSVKFFNHWAGSHYANPFYKLLRKAGAMTEYALAFGDEADRKLALEAARVIAPKYVGNEPNGYCNISGAVCGYAHLWEENPELMTTVKYQLETTRRLFLAFEKLPSGEKGVERWLSRANFSKCSYEANFTFPGLGLLMKKPDGTVFKFKSGQPRHLRLMFTVSTAAAPLFSLPVAIGVLSGCIDAGEVVP